MTVAPAYVVLHVQIGAHEDETDPGVGGRVAARRKLRRVQGRLEHWAQQPVLGLLEPVEAPPRGLHGISGQVTEAVVVLVTKFNGTLVVVAPAPSPGSGATAAALIKIIKAPL